MIFIKPDKTISVARRVILHLSLFVCILACLAYIRACYRAICNTGPANCRWGDWGDWGPCSGYRQFRQRSIATFGRCGDTPCVGSSSESRTCNAADAECMSAGGKCQFTILPCDGGRVEPAIQCALTIQRCCIKNAPPPATTQSPDDIVAASWSEEEDDSDILVQALYLCAFILRDGQGSKMCERSLPNLIYKSDKDQSCESRGGTCQEDSIACGGAYSSGLCSGSSSRRCCLPNAMSNDGACHDHGGVCTEASGCADELQSGLCGDHTDTTIVRKCCIPARKNNGSACFARMCSTHANNEARQCDPDGYGCGYYKSSRGLGMHLGVDIKCAADATVYAPFAGTIVRLAAPYKSGKACCNKGILIRGNGKFNGWEAKIFYVTPTIAEGVSFTKGQAIATHVSLHCPDCYKTTMTDHVHIELYKPLSAVRTDPTPYVFCTTPG